MKYLGLDTDLTDLDVRILLFHSLGGRWPWFIPSQLRANLSLALEQKQVINELCYKFNLVASKDTTFHVV